MGDFNGDNSRHYLGKYETGYLPDTCTSITATRPSRKYGVQPGPLCRPEALLLQTMMKTEIWTSMFQITGSSLTRFGKTTAKANSLKSKVKRKSMATEDLVLGDIRSVRVLEISIMMVISTSSLAPATSSYQDSPAGKPRPDSSFTFQDLSSEAGLGWQESFASPTLGDFDNDGLLDLYFTTVYPGDHCVLYKNLGNFKFQNVTATSGVSADLTYQAGWADFDGDGDLDLATRGRIYRNNNAASNYLRLAITAKSPLDSNAIGAVARIKLGEKTLTRQVAVSTGQGNANSPILHFGLGDISGDVSVEFTWLGGGKKVFKLAANQLQQISIP